jgi:iron complex outermembrane receptor protein
MDKLAAALNSCPLEKLDQSTREIVPTTIKERQEAGCYNPFYSSVTNSAAIDPLGLSGASAASQNGFITTDSDAPGEEGYGVQDGGYICDPNDPSSPACPAQFDRNGDGVFELAGTPNTKQVMDRLMGEHIAVQRRELGTADGILRGDLARWDTGGLPFAVGAQYRRETLEIDYDAAYNQRLYAFLFGAPDVPNVSRNIASGFAELRPSFASGLFELQVAARLEHFDDVGTTVSPLAGLMVRPFAGSSAPPEALEWLLFRAHAGWGYRAPSLMQLHGTQTEFHSVEFFGSTHFVPHQIAGNPDLDFEKYTTVSPGLQWDFKGLHVGADFWLTSSDNLIAADNAQTLMRDCQSQYEMASADCAEQVLLSGTRTLDHIESSFGNIAEVDTNGIDGGISYTLDTKRRGLGDAGTFVIGVQGTYINSYLIKSPRALREFYRDATQGDALPTFNMDGTRDYDNVYAEYEAAGYRNVENFAPAMPKLRLSVPLRWLYSGHVVGATMRYVDGYNDDSEQTVERYADVLPNGAFDINNLALAEGEAIPSWVVFDANYGFTVGDDDQRIQLAVGVLNLLDADPPEVESPLGYEVGVHDPRGRLIYVRVTGAL